MHYDSLRHLGIDESMTRVYIALLELESARAIDIAQKTGMNKSTVYDNLDKLAHLHLITVKQKEKVRIYTPNDPKRLQVMIDRQKEEVASSIPFLSALYTNSQKYKPQIQLFEGEEGVRWVLRESNTNNLEKRVRLFQSLEVLASWAKTLPVETREYTHTRIAKNIEQQYLRARTSQKNIQTVTELAKSQGDEWKRSIRYMPLNVELASTLSIWDDHVAIISNKEENYTTLITSRDFATTMKTLFDSLWELSIEEDELPRSTPR